MSWTKKANGPSVPGEPYCDGCDNTKANCKCPPQKTADMKYDAPAELQKLKDQVLEAHDTAATLFDQIRNGEAEGIEDLHADVDEIYDYLKNAWKTVERISEAKSKGKKK
ncbi:hypothetical protein [Methylobacter sp.]|uniref:hypothetical protein n=1 Tax=Methylobacter sp. TaxID=2051955 RepID=UPI001202C06B|nr:hypothetical protein [Methylobacter sp.]TAK59487.1 MAG: hypothetical protein EPO18_20200 [Methylobacter sp.]